MRDPSDFGTRHYSNRERLQSFGPGGAVWGGVFLALVAVIGLALLIGVPAYRSFTARHTAEVVLTDKDRVCETTSEGSECKYLVYTDKTTYGQPHDHLSRWCRPRVRQPQVLGLLRRPA
jgi:hypothetical protein